jgi:toxin CptA
MAATLTPFSANLIRSRLWLALVLLAHAGLVLVLLTYLPGAAWLLAAMPLTLWLSLAPDGWLPGSRRVTRLAVDPRGRLSVGFDRDAWPNGAMTLAEPLDDCFISTWLVVLNLRIDGRRHSVAVWPDAAPAEFRRALRVYLLWFQAADKPAAVVDV